MPTQASTRKIPTPLYAAAGAGDLAYEQLRKLPEQVANLRGRVAEIRPAVSGAVSEVNLRADLDRLRSAARRNAVAFVSSAQAAQEKAVERAVDFYGDLVTRGEKVVRNSRGAEATVALVPSAGAVTAEITTTPPPVSAAQKPAAKATKAPVKRTAPVSNRK